MVNELARELLGLSATAQPMERKLQALIQKLRREAHLLVWDNLESATGIPGTEVQPQLPQEDLELLAGLLKDLRDGKTKALLTSRKKETNWLPLSICFRVPLGGLEGEELWEYCNAVVRYLGLTLDRDNMTYRRILEKLCSNPLAIRAILLRLQDCTPEDLLRGLDRAFEGQEGDESTRRLQAAYAVFGESLKSRFLPVLQVTGLHEYYADADLVREMLAAAEEPVPPEAAKSCFEFLENAGFCTHVGGNVYRLHPALRGYLQQQLPAPKEMQEKFVSVMEKVSNTAIILPNYVYKNIYNINIINFYHARQLAESLGMNMGLMTLTRSLAHYAQESRQFSEANRLYQYLLGRREIQDDEERTMVYHQLGVIAQEQWNFESAKTWYKKSLDVYKENYNKLFSAYTYHQLGTITQWQRNFTLAEEYYMKSLKIKIKYKDEEGIANTCDQLGILAWEQQDFKLAKKWCEESLEIWKKHGDKRRTAGTYHQLGVIAQEQQDFASAEARYKNSLEIKEENDDEYGAAITYHQLGRIAEEQRDFQAAEEWYQKSLAIKEKQGDEYGAALTYGQLGVLAAKQRDVQSAAAHFLKAIEGLASTGDEYHLAIAVHNYARLLHTAPPSEREALRSRWEEQMPKEMAEYLTECLKKAWKNMEEDANDAQE